MDTPESFAAELRAASVKVSRQARGILAKKLDAAAASAQSQFLASQGAGGRGMGGSAGTIRARMSARDGGTRQVGYVLADGPGVFFWEYGAGHRPPTMAVHQAVARALDAAGPEIAQAGRDTLAKR